MKSPSRGVRVRVDRQGRLVLPQSLRREIVSAPGEVLVRSTPDGVLLSAVAPSGGVSEGADGLPLLSLGRPVSNDEVIDAIDRGRASR